MPASGFAKRGGQLEAWALSERGQHPFTPGSGGLSHCLSFSGPPWSPRSEKANSYQLTSFAMPFAWAVAGELLSRIQTLSTEMSLTTTIPALVGAYDASLNVHHPRPTMMVRSARLVRQGTTAMVHQWTISSRQRTLLGSLSLPNQTNHL